MACLGSFLISTDRCTRRPLDAGHGCKMPIDHVLLPVRTDCGSLKTLAALAAL